MRPFRRAGSAISSLFSVPFRVTTRTAAFLVKELVVALGQPRLLLSVIVGPFLLLFLFGLGFTGQRDPFRIMLVVPKQQGVPTQTDFYRRFFFWQLKLVDVSTDEQAAMARLHSHDRTIDAVIVAPQHPMTDLATNQAAQFHVYYNALDPIDGVRLDSLIYGHTRELNTRIVAAMLSAVLQSAGVPQAQSQDQSSVEQLRAQLTDGNSGGAMVSIDRMLAAIEILRVSGQAAYGVAKSPAEAGPAAPELARSESILRSLRGEVGPQSTLDTQQRQQLTELQDTARQWPDVMQAAAKISPERLAAPIDYDVKNLAPVTVTYVRYYAPVVLILLLQHVAITLAALSVIRERTRGTVELFRVAPVRLGEILIGKALSFGALLATLATILLTLLVVALHVPLLGNIAIVALVIGLLIAISLSIGFIVAAISTTESQAVQLAMLVLLIAVFFGGLFVPIATLSWPIRGIAYAIPVTHAGSALQVLMLRGDLVPLQSIGALVLMLLILGPLASLLMRRSYASSGGDGS
ncbi:MAG: ABC transporter permease [Dehalococcoidia bacterium]